MFFRALDRVNASKSVYLCTDADDARLDMEWRGAYLDFRLAFDSRCGPLREWSGTWSVLLRASFECFRTANRCTAKSPETDSKPTRSRLEQVPKRSRSNPEAVSKQPRSAIEDLPNSTRSAYCCTSVTFLISRVRSLRLNCLLLYPFN